MPVEIRTSDGRHWARPAYQNHDAAPLIRMPSPHEIRRRKRQATMFLILFSSVLLALALLSERAFSHG